MNPQLKFQSQAVAWPYFGSAVALFLLQTVFGLLLAAQFVWPSLAATFLPFNVARASHLNLLVFWLLIGLMGASYYLVPEETERELYSTKLAYVQLGILLISGVGALATFWLTGDSMGKPFTEAPMPWPIGIALGAVLFLLNLGATIFAAVRRTAIVVVLFFGMAGLSALYLLNMPFYENLAVDYFWWWWVIHLWVEGTWELIAAAIGAWLLIKLTGVNRQRMYRWLYVEVALVMFTGILGIGHHYYWIGTPGYWLTLGAVFSAFEPLPLVLMTWDAFHSLKASGRMTPERVPMLWMVGGAIGHLLGAGVWGFAMTLPQINRWTHGTLLTAAHGHFAFYGAFGMLVLAFAAWSYSRLRAPRELPVTHGIWSFWLMVTGMLSMVMAFTIAGVVQTYLWRVVGFDFMQVRTEYITAYMVAVLVAGVLMFVPGAALFAWDYFHLGRRSMVPTPAILPMKAVTPAVLVLCLFGLPADALAHCDSIGGPVVAAARAALEARDVTPALKWVRPTEEQAVRLAFEQTLAVRLVNATARDLADRYFFETLVRLHRFGEGEPYTGLKDETTIDPLIERVDKAVASGDVDDLVAVLTHDVEAGIRERFALVRARQKTAQASVEAGRHYVEAYVDLIHYVEHFHAPVPVSHER